MRKIVCCLVLICMIPVCCAVFGSLPLSEGAIVITPAPQEEGQMVFLSVIDSEPVFAGDGTDAFTKTLQATIYPSGASDKSVDWSVAWGPGAANASSPVTNYVTVTPTSDGSTTATVKCIKAFGSDTILITVTTRLGGHTATCTVSYVGYPTSVSIDTTGKTLATVTGITKQAYQIYNGKTNTFPIVLSNELNSVATRFNDFTVSVQANGKPFLYSYPTYGEVIDDSCTRVDVFPSSDGKTCNVYAYVQSTQQSIPMFSVSVSGSTLSIDVYEEFYSMAANGTELGTTGYAGNMSSDSYLITVSQPEFGLSASVTVYVYVSATGVSLDYSDITF